MFYKSEHNYDKCSTLDSWPCLPIATMTPCSRLEKLSIWVARTVHTYPQHLTFNDTETKMIGHANWALTTSCNQWSTAAMDLTTGHQLGDVCVIIVENHRKCHGVIVSFHYNWKTWFVLYSNHCLRMQNWKLASHFYFPTSSNEIF